ncbi:MAG: flavodoxin-dependent (E)-4-hydroxy-3-methylbut-2-enyl-diphosphate synthase [Epulopiscium sp.]|nr:flavodoxin-dependent (E)-4-hydroxy-3-methylbut-2-enyl-diphosphate synthase [Candidatus Epulonipiscium sp.]
MQPFQRNATKVVAIGNVLVGGNHPISIQSMTNTDTRDVEATVKQIWDLEKEGCEIIRVAVPDMKAAQSLGAIKSKIHIPLVADIHFDYRLAIESINQGVDKLRINPGNIGSKERIKAVVEVAKKHNIPIRIGVNAGSLEQTILERYGGVTAEGLVESALRHIMILEQYNFTNIIVSLKASSIPLALSSYMQLAQKVDYPLHIGITEAGTLWSGTIKSAAGIGSLLAQGLGDTLRVSLTGDPLEEVRCAKQILQSLGLRKFGAEIISCPTCGRTEINLIRLAEEVEKRCQHLTKPITVAVMGCVVNGPGEAKEADIGIAGGKGVGVIFKKGQLIKRVPEDQLLQVLMEEIEKMQME